MWIGQYWNTKHQNYKKKLTHWLEGIYNSEYLYCGSIAGLNLSSTYLPCETRRGRTNKTLEEIKY